MRQPTQQDFKEFVDQNEENYIDARDEAFRVYTNIIVRDSLKEYLEKVAEEGDYLDFEDFLYGTIHYIGDKKTMDFDFPDKEQWLRDEYEGYLGDYIDMAYEEEKERRLGF